MQSSNAAPLVARFQFNDADSRAFNAIAQGRTDTSKRANIARAIVFLVTLLVVATITFKLSLPATTPTPLPRANTNNFDWMSVASLVVPLLIFGAFWIFILYNQKQARLAIPAFKEPSTITLDAGGMTQQAGTISTRVEWRGITRVAATDDHLCLFTPGNNGFVVPRRAFDDDQSWQRFVDFARERWQQSQPTLPPIAAA